MGIQIVANSHDWSMNPLRVVVPGHSKAAFERCNSLCFMPREWPIYI